MTLFSKKAVLSYSVGYLLYVKSKNAGPAYGFFRTQKGLPIAGRDPGSAALLKKMVSYIPFYDKL
jgi:hypothetical protein